MPPRTEAGASSLPRVGSSTAQSIYPTDSVQDVAEALGLPPLKESIAATLAADVEYRLRQVIQDASKFMRHGKRSQLRIADVDRALKQRNLDPIFGFHPTTLGKSSVSGSYPTPVGSTFRRIQTQSGPIHIISEEEIDLDKVLENNPKIGLGPGVGWSAHWLAIEGVQPAVPQNPVLARSAVNYTNFANSAIANGAVANGAHTAAGSVQINGASAVLTGSGGQTGQTIAKPLIKHVLSRELQLYFERLTSAILDPPREAELDATKSKAVKGVGGGSDKDGNIDGDISMADAGDDSTNQDRTLAEVTASIRQSSGNTVRNAALASLRGDSGLHQLVPYLIQWIGEKIQVGLRDEKLLQIMLHTISAIIMNPYLGIEAYLHQLLPFVLSILLTSSLGSTSQGDNAYQLREQAAVLLAYLVEQYGSTYATLRSRLIRTILTALDAGCNDSDEEVGTISGKRARTSMSPSPSGNLDGKGPKESTATKLGALIGLRMMGTGAIRTILVQDHQFPNREPSCFLKRLGNWCQKVESIDQRKREVESVVKEVTVMLEEIGANDASSQGKEATQAKASIERAFGRYWMSKLSGNEGVDKALKGFLTETL